MSVRKSLLHVKDVFQLSQEPLIDVGHLPDFINRITAIERSGDCEDALVSWVQELLIDILDKIILQKQGS